MEIATHKRATRRDIHDIRAHPLSPVAMFGIMEIENIRYIRNEEGEEEELRSGRGPNNKAAVCIFAPAQ